MIDIDPTRDVILEISASDNDLVAKIELYVDGYLAWNSDPVAPAITQTVTISELSPPDQQHTVKVVAEDPSGNKAEWTETLNPVSVDTEPPTISVAVSQ